MNDHARMVDVGSIPLTHLESLKAKKKRMMNQLASNLRSFKFKQVNLEFQRDDREAMEAREFDSFIKEQRAKRGCNRSTQARPKKGSHGVPKTDQRYYSRNPVTAEPLNCFDPNKLAMSMQRHTNAINPADLHCGMNRLHLQSAAGQPRLFAYNDFRDMTCATTASGFQHFFSQGPSAFYSGLGGHVVGSKEGGPSQQDYAETLGLSEQNWLRSTTKLLTQQLHQAKRQQERQAIVRSSGQGVAWPRQFMTGFKAEMQQMMQTEKELHDQIEKRKGAMPLRYELKSAGGGRARTLPQPQQALPAAKGNSPDGRSTHQATEIKKHSVHMTSQGAVEMQWEAVSARPADQEIPLESTSSRGRFAQSAQKQKH